MNRLFATILAFFAGSASAVGTYDGIYQVGSSTEYYSVHQSGNHMVVGVYYIFPSSLWAVSNSNGFTLPQSNLWDLLGGDLISSSTVQLTGQMVLGFCNAVATATFDSTKARITIIQMSNTATANSAGFSCPALLQAFQAANGGAWSYSATKIF